MTVYLTLHVGFMLNVFPAKGGISTYYSPHQLLNQRNITYAKHCAYEFGTYVQCNHFTEPTNMNEPRVLDAIYLRATLNTQGGHDLMDLATGELITRSKVTPLPMTQAVINRVNTLGFQQGWTELIF